MSTNNMLVMVIFSSNTATCFFLRKLTSSFKTDKPGMNKQCSQAVSIVLIAVLFLCVCGV